MICLQPKKVEFQLKLRQSKLIYKAFKEIRESPDWENLNEARKRVVDCECELIYLKLPWKCLILLHLFIYAVKLKEAVLYGVSLEDASRERFNEIEQVLFNKTN